VIAVISLSAVLTGTVIATIASLFRFDNHITQHVEERTELQRLSDSVRLDLHQATDLQWDNTEQILNLKQPKQQNIRYQITEGRWVRIADQEGVSTKRRSYGLSESFRCSCEPATALQGTPVRVWFESNRDDENNPAGQSRPEMQCEIITTVGRNFDLLSE